MSSFFVHLKSVSLGLHIKVAPYQVLKVLNVQGVGLVSYCDWLSDSDDMITASLIGQNYLGVLCL